MHLEDLDWILEDAATRHAANERQLAINAALKIAAGAAWNPAILAKIESVATLDDATNEVWQGFVAPRPRSQSDLESEHMLKEVQEQAELKRSEDRNSWLSLAAEVRQNAGALRDVRPSRNTGVDYRIYNLWRLLFESRGRDRTYALDNVSMLEPMFGKEVTAAFREALVHYWRNWTPLLKSEREAGKRNQVRDLDCIGIAGISLEASSTRDWANSLSSKEARLAAEYATIEFSGLPDWSCDLAASHPQEVAEVLLTEVLDELNNNNPGLHYKVLSDIAFGDTRVKSVMAEPFWAELRKGVTVPAEALKLLLKTICGGLPAQDTELEITHVGAL